MNNEILDLLSDLYFAPIQDLLSNDKYSDIYIHGADSIWVKENNSIIKKEKHRFENDKKLKTAINIIARKLYVPLNEIHPVLDARFKTGERINIVIPPVSQHPVVSIRKFMRKFQSTKQLIEAGMIDQKGIEIIEFFVKAKKRIIISGATNSGKTTLLNLACSFIPKHEKVITVEDTREISIDNPLWVSLIPRHGETEKQRNEQFDRVLKNTLRMDPNYLAIGEIRGSEISHLLSAFNSGSGGMATIHANCPVSTLARMETLLKTHTAINEKAIRQYLKETIDIIIHLKSLPDRSKRVTDIIEITKQKASHVNWLYEFAPGKIWDGQPITGEFKLGNRPDFLDRENFICEDTIPHFWK